MKVCVTANGSTLESTLDPRFGRADYFVIVDTNTMEFEPVENSAAQAAGGAGITSAQSVVDKGITVVITGNVGPNAMNVLKAGEIEIYKGLSASIKENVEKYNKGLLEKIDKTVPRHFGMNM